MFKQCSQCGKEFPATPEHFRPGTGKNGGVKNPCKHCRNQAHRHWRELNPGYGAEWRRANPDANSEGWRKWMRERPERALESYRKWWFGLPDEKRSQINRAKKAARRARGANSSGRYNAVQVATLLASQKNRCWWCGKHLEAYHADHRVPLSRGGSNDVSNIVISCPPCNRKKHNKLPWEMPNRPRLL